VSVSTVKKSQARMLVACWRRNCCQLSPIRRGCRLEARGEQDPPDAARRDGEAELAELAGDAWVAPARVLARELEHELADVLGEWRASRPARRGRPFAADEFAVPAQQRLWSDGEAAAPVGRELPGECGQEGAVGRLELRPGFLASEHGELVAEREQLDFLSEAVMSAGREQSQDGGEGEVAEGEQHPAILAKERLPRTRLLRGRLRACG
jgi:hypothetical protein